MTTTEIARFKGDVTPQGTSNVGYDSVEGVTMLDANGEPTGYRPLTLAAGVAPSDVDAAFEAGGCTVFGGDVANGVMPMSLYDKATRLLGTFTINAG